MATTLQSLVLFSLVWSSALGSWARVFSPKQRRAALHGAGSLYIPAALADKVHELLRLVADKSSRGGGKGLSEMGEPSVPECIAQAERLVHETGRLYTDELLQMLLKQECFVNENFVNEKFEPRTQTVSPNGRKTCMKFAKLLVAARNIDEKTGSKRGYEDFCHAFVEHEEGQKAGVVANKTAESKTESKAQDMTANEAEDTDEAQDAVENKALDKTENVRPSHSAEKGMGEKIEKAPAEGKKRSWGNFQRENFPIWPVVLFVGLILCFVIVAFNH